MVGQRSKLPRIRRVEIAGGIASGKTTLARLLAAAGLNPIHEQFRKNPFFEAFYRDPVGTALETEFTFLLQHYHAEKCLPKQTRGYCADFSFLLDRAYAAVTLSSRDRRMFNKFIKRLERDLPTRFMTIYLKCAPEIQLERIRRRDRIAERTITIDYLRRVDASLRQIVNRAVAKEKVLVIDSGKIDFAHKIHASADVVGLVKNTLSKS